MPIISVMFNSRPWIKSPPKSRRPIFACFSPMFHDFSGWWLSHPSEKNEFVNWDDYSKYMEKSISVMFQSPPTSSWLLACWCPFNNSWAPRTWPWNWLEALRRPHGSFGNVESRGYRPWLKTDGDMLHHPQLDVAWDQWVLYDPGILWI